MRKYPKRVENYTTAFLVTSALILFMAFLTLAAIKGLVWVLLTAAMMETALRLREAKLRNR